MFRYEHTDPRPLPTGFMATLLTREPYSTSFAPAPHGHRDTTMSPLVCRRFPAMCGEDLGASKAPPPLWCEKYPQLCYGGSARPARMAAPSNAFDACAARCFRDAACEDACRGGQPFFAMDHAGRPWADRNLRQVHSY